MAKLTLIICSLLLAGCCTAPRVEYRVADVPEPPVITRPDLGSLNITYNMPLEQIVQVMREDIKKLQAAFLKSETALDVYRKKEPK